MVDRQLPRKHMTHVLLNLQQPVLEPFEGLKGVT